MLTREQWIALGTKIGTIVAEKNSAYGDSVRKSAIILNILYPEIPRETMSKILLTVRILDKLSRIANDPGFGDEDPSLDISGYGLLFHDLIVNGVVPEDCNEKEDNGRDG